MLRFGKHKGKTLKDVIQTDVQYVQWLYKHSMTYKLDKDDRLTLEYVLRPLKDIRLISSNTNELIIELKKRGLLKHIEYNNNKCLIDSVFLKHEIEKENIDVFFEIVSHFYIFSTLK